MIWGEPGKGRMINANEFKSFQKDSMRNPIKGRFKQLIIIFFYNKCNERDLMFSVTESCLFLTECHLKNWRSKAFDSDFQPCPLHTVISPDSLNLLMILCTVDVLCNGLHNFTLRNLILKLFHNLEMKYFGNRWTSAHLYLGETLRSPSPRCSFLSSVMLLFWCQLI